MMNDNAKERHYTTVHDENYSIAKFLGIIAIFVSAFYTIRGLFMGETIVEGIIESWFSGFGIVLLLFILIVDFVFFIDWILYLCVKKIVISKGTKHDGIIISEIEKKNANRGAVRRSWKYTIELEDGSLYLSTAYTNQIPMRKCTVYVWGSRCILTSFET